MQKIYIPYLNNDISCKNILIDDLNNVLVGLSSGASSNVQHSQPDSSSIDTDVSLSVGNHVTVFWFDQTCLARSYQSAVRKKILYNQD